MSCKFSLPLAFAMLCAVVAASANDSRRALVLVSDFGLTERFVASMKGVAVSVDSSLRIYDLTHQIEPFNIWQVSYMLAGTIDYWPKGTVFVSVVDPGVGTERRSVVAKTKSGHFVVTPDNGSLTLVADKQGIAALRQIDETTNRRSGSEDSHTFHGRDIYSYTGARLAANAIRFEDVGPELDAGLVRLDYQRSKRLDNNTIVGNIAHIEMPFGNVVTNIPRLLLDDVLALAPDASPNVRVQISHAGKPVFEKEIPYVLTFGAVGQGEPVLYSDSLQTIGLAVNRGDFAKEYRVAAGARWTIRVSKMAPPR